LAFDVFGTVVDWRSSIIRELEEFGRTHGLQQDWPTFADNWRAGYAPAMDRVRRGELPWTRIDDLHRMILEACSVRRESRRSPTTTSTTSTVRGTGSTRGRTAWAA
jgi:2-haloacid dehalogenase